jgi:hypothetical protein
MHWSGWHLSYISEPEHTLDCLLRGSAIEWHLAPKNHKTPKTPKKTSKKTIKPKTPKKTSQKHHKNITKNITKTSQKHHKNITKTSKTPKMGVGTRTRGSALDLISNDGDSDPMRATT